MKSISLLVIGVVLYAIWLLVLFSWILLHSFQMEGRADGARRVSDLLLTATAILTVTVPACAMYRRTRVVSFLSISLLAAWTLIVPAAFVFSGPGVFDYDGVMVVDIMSLMLERGRAVVNAPIFLAVYLIGFSSLLILVARTKPLSRRKEKYRP